MEPADTTVSQKFLAVSFYPESATEHNPWNTSPNMERGERSGAVRSVIGH